jgi:hypothetical protein
MQNSIKIERLKVIFLRHVWGVKVLEHTTVQCIIHITIVLRVAVKEDVEMEQSLCRPSLEERMVNNCRPTEWVMAL